MFGILPTGFRSFTVTPRLADGWNQMALRHIRAFGSDFDLEVSRVGGAGSAVGDSSAVGAIPGNSKAKKLTERLELRLTNHITGTTKTYKLAPGATLSVKL